MTIDASWFYPRVRQQKAGQTTLGTEPAKDKAKGMNEEGKNIRHVINPTEGRRNLEQSKTGPVATQLKKLKRQLNQDE